ncbi:hypothetical protein MES5069_1670004 [Mesorhizobium escarrei]|uniref:DUF1403 family protein n=1 Tax=Mesorhizobium escarrei TaxID=666018 RepID=A0ABM9DKL3_9HYPH|nr:hypothetical protein MES5069_1670004 [Mesorhizobium escarrei]
MDRRSIPRADRDVPARRIARFASVGDLADELRQLAATQGAVGMLTGAFVAVQRCDLPRSVGCWLADALLAATAGLEPCNTASGRRGGFGYECR